MSGTATSIQRLCEVLTRLARGPVPFTVLRRDLSLTQSTLSRLLRGAQTASLVRMTEHGWALDHGAAALAIELLDRSEEGTRAAAALRALAKETGQTASFWLWDGRQVVLAAVSQVPHGFQHLPLFTRWRAWQSAFGLAVLAVIPRDRARRVLANARQRNDLSAAALTTLRAAEVDGVVHMWEPVNHAHRCVGAVWVDGHVVGSVGISMTGKPSSAERARLATCVRAAAQRLSTDLMH